MTSWKTRRDHILVLALIKGKNLKTELAASDLLINQKDWTELVRTKFVLSLSAKCVPGEGKRGVNCVVCIYGKKMSLKLTRLKTTCNFRCEKRYKIYLQDDTFHHFIILKIVCSRSEDKY